MDQQHALLTDGSYNLAEIWQYSMTDGGGGGGGSGGGRGSGDGGSFNNNNNNSESGLGLGLRRGHFGHFNDNNDIMNHHHRDCDPLEQQQVSGGKKRRDDDDDNANANNNNLSGDGNRKRIKTLGNKDDNNNRESNNGGEAAEPSSGKPEPPKDYIHVRARRGQATDSHSLAERARREKISERMKILQDLVPGCNKVIGKALVLDEIINYVQSLQRQVEFLSMKLEAVNSRMSPGIEAFPPKDFGQQFDTSGMAFGSHPPREYNRGTSPEWLHMQIGGGFERPT